LLLNLRAADISLEFFDPAHASRYAIIKPAAEQRILAWLAPLMNIAGSWRSGRARKKSIRRLRRSADSPLDSMPSWRPILLERRSSSGADDDSGEASALGVFGRELDKPKVSFALPDKPFSADKWFYTQHLVASVTVADSEDQHTFHPPYVPEWNEFYARTMNFQYNKTRIEPERNGIVISVADHDPFRTAFLFLRWSSNCSFPPDSGQS
jgi:hypothetical protein